MVKKEHKERTFRYRRFLSSLQLLYLCTLLKKHVLILLSSIFQKEEKKTVGSLTSLPCLLVGVDILQGLCDDLVAIIDRYCRRE